MKGVTKRLDLALRKVGLRPSQIMSGMESILANTYKIDVVKFDKLLHQRGYNEKEHGSMAMYIESKVGKEDMEYIKSFL